MEAQTNPASWPWFQLMSDALEGRLAGKAPRVAPVWTNEEESIYVASPPADRDCLMGERSSLSELDSMVEADADADGAITFIDASGEECSVPSDPAYKSESRPFHPFQGLVLQQLRFCAEFCPSLCSSVGPGHPEDDQTTSHQRVLVHRQEERCQSGLEVSLLHPEGGRSPHTACLSV